MRKILSLMVALCLLLGACALAEEAVDEEIFSLTGAVTELTPDTVTVTLPYDETPYTFAYGPEALGEDAPMAEGELITIFYSGYVDWDNADASGVKVLYIEAGGGEREYNVVYEDESVNADFDGDGSEETASLAPVSVDYGSVYALTIGGASFVSEIQSQPQALVCDLDPEDGRLDVILSGDVMSDDYVTWRLQYDGTDFILLGEPFGGLAESFQEGFVTVSGWVDVLGTHWGETTYALDEEGNFSQLEDGEWYFFAESEDMELYAAKAISPIIALPVTLFTDQGETAAMLPPGTVMHLLSSDLSTSAYFETDDGLMGYVRLSPSEKGWGLDVAGSDETVYFDALPYSG